MRVHGILIDHLVKDSALICFYLVAAYIGGNTQIWGGGVDTPFQKKIKSITKIRL